MIAQKIGFEAFEEPVEGHDGLKLRSVGPRSGKLVAAVIGVAACPKGEESAKN
ncbi:MAG: hypothetical protein ACHBNF_11265 [Chromatiales bacterium]